uniref:Ribonuclease H-like domain-containing protein n=1 Tax=Tanacetum cinerariifolium TaxID=118510 RepID=A0A6L2J483_TANCI|nr:ribonuclease H-like domain-containing protein [Tanacetum cinerariifolium]
MTGDTPPSIVLLSNKLMTITNLRTRVPVLLDVEEMNYSSWMYFFQNLYRGYNLLDHIMGESKDDPTSNGSLSRYNARLVANGSTQIEGVDVDETFSLVVKPCTIQMVLSLAISRHWPVHQLDVKNAFLNDDLSKTVYMRQPLWFQDSTHLDYVSLLKRLLYGLKHASRAWFHRFDTYITRPIIAPLHQEFSMTDLSSLNYFLGNSVTRDSLGMFLSQRQYPTEILKRVHMVSCISSRIPIDTESKLGDDVQQVCLYMHDPREPHLSAFKRILRYVRGTLDYSLQLFSSSTTSLVAYSDADWAGCLTTRRSTSGYCVLLGNNLLWWSSKRQPTLSRSSAEAEYHCVANVVAETCCINVRSIEIDIHFARDLVAASQVRVLHVPSRYQYADVFTKGLSSALFEEFRSSLSIWCSPAPTAKEC